MENDGKIGLGDLQYLVVVVKGGKLFILYFGFRILNSFLAFGGIWMGGLEL